MYEKNFLDIEEFVGKDIIFLFLQLISFPIKETGIIYIKDLATFRYKRLNKKDLLDILLELQENGALEIRQSEHDGPTLDITKETIEFIWNTLNLYINRFIDGNLLSNRGIPYNFKKQKELFLEKIESSLADSQAILNFSDADFDNRFSFFECFLAMEKQGYIEIKKIINEKIPTAKAYYMISFEVKNKSLNVLGIQKERRRLKLRCFKKGLTGYFQIKKDSVPKEIGHKNSRHFMLLEFLVRKGVEEKISFKQAYRAMKDGRHYNISKYEDDAERAIINAKKYLQKGGKIKPYQIKLDKEQRHIWIE